MHKHIFISGIDTDCGKTFITGKLASALKRSGVNCITSKFIQTGCQGISEDIIAHRKEMNIELCEDDKNGNTCPIVFSFPASPHLAAELDNTSFNLKEIEKGIEALKNNYELVITEGAGGLTVPLTRSYLTSDYLKESQLPVVLVSSSKLGSINHTLLSIEHCISQNIQLTAVIFNQFPEHDKTIAADSFNYLKNYLSSKHPNIKLVHLKDLKEKAKEILE